MLYVFLLIASELYHRRRLRGGFQARSRSWNYYGRWSPFKQRHVRVSRTTFRNVSEPNSYVDYVLLLKQISKLLKAWYFNNSSIFCRDSVKLILKCLPLFLFSFWDNIAIQPTQLLMLFSMQHDVHFWIILKSIGVSIKHALIKKFVEDFGNLYIEISLLSIVH